MSHPLSICIITYNEEANIRRCLESVQWADEIVVVDSGSEDATVEICKEYTEKVIHNPFVGHIEQKNFAISQASHQWIFSLDADEEVSIDLKNEIRDVLRTETIEKGGFEVPRKNDYLGQWATYGSFYPDRKLRLFHRDRGKWGGINPHDHIVLKGKKGRLKNPLLHYTYKNLAHHIDTVNSYTTIAAGEVFAKKRPAFPMVKAILHGVGRFLHAYFIKWAIFYGARGFLFSLMHGYYGFSKYAKVWELCQQEKKK